MKRTHSSVSRLICLGLVLCSGGLAGCARNKAEVTSSVPAVFASEQPPGDFALSVTVYARPGASRRTVPPPEKRPARYILEPDWILRAQLSAAPSEQLYPSRTRQLDQSHVRVLWQELRESGLTNINHPAIVGRVPEPVDTSGADPGDGSAIPPVYAVSYIAGGIRRTLSLQGGDEAAAMPLVRALAEAARIGR